MSDADKNQNAKLTVASMFALIVAVSLEGLATTFALRDRATLMPIVLNLGAELPGISEWAMSINPLTIVFVAILAGISLVAKEYIIKRRLVSCLINILAIPLVGLVYWAYHSALLIPLINVIRALS